LKKSSDSTLTILSYFFVMPWILIGLGKAATFFVPFFPEIVRDFYYDTWRAFALSAGFPGVIAFCIIFVALPGSTAIGAVRLGYRWLMQMTSVAKHRG
jgi:hypothetical protein